MELWRWVQASPAVHLVSRRVQTSLPGFPNGLVLHDVAVTRSRLHGRSEDLLFAEDQALQQKVRRGLSFAEPAGASDGVATVLRRGLPKFFDLDVAVLADSMQTSTSFSAKSLARETSDCSGKKLQKLASKGLVARLQDAWLAGRRITLSKLEKANGENAQVSYFSPTGQWVLCSKNVSLLASSSSEIALPQWADHRYRFARHVAELWFAQLAKLEELACQALREALSARTLVGELIGGSGAHLVDYGETRSLRWFAMVPHEGDEPCWAPARSLAFLHDAGLPTVVCEQVGPVEGCGSPAELLETLRAASMAAESASLAEAGEGFVLYFNSVSNDSENDDTAKTVWLGKMKTAEYRLMRRLREKAKQFARGAGCILVEDVLEEYRSDASAYSIDASLAENHCMALERLCRYIYAEDIPPEVVDEQFLQLLAKAKEFRGEDGPRPPAPALCVLAPPFLVDATIWESLQKLVGCRDHELRGPSSVVEGLSEGGLLSSWHRSSASEPAVYLNQVPRQLEKALLPSAAGVAAPPRKRRRRAAAEERHKMTACQVAEDIRRRRCLFVLWGWSDESCAESELLQSSVKDEPSVTCFEAGLRKRFEHSTGTRTGPYHSLILKWQSQARHLRQVLPPSRTLWIPGMPSNDCRAFSTISESWKALQQGRCALSEDASVLSEVQSSCRPAQVIAVLPVGLPGMGKSSLLEQIFLLSKRSARHHFHQGLREDIATSKRSVGSEHAQPWEKESADSFGAVSFLSSDGFTGAELKAAGLNAERSSSQDIARSRRLAASKYRRAIEEYLAFAAADAERQQSYNTFASEKGAVDPAAKSYLLLLDKNYPPSALRREAESLFAAAATAKCQIQIKVLALDSCEGDAEKSITSAELQLLEEEEREFGPWAYPWSPDVVIECMARLLLRSEHDTLVGGETSLFVLLSFLRLYHRHLKPGEANVAGLEIIKASFVSTGGDMSSWADASSNQSSSSDGESVWRRFELRALLRQTLQLLQNPFGDPLPTRPLLAAMRKCLADSRGHSPGDAQRRAHVESCAAKLLPQLHAATTVESSAGTTPQVTPPVRYVCLRLDSQQKILNDLLAQLSSAMGSTIGSSAGGEAFPSPPFEVPREVHATTCYLGGGAALSEVQRHLLAASKRLFREGCAFDCFVTHLVGARGALALAVLDEQKLRAAGVPLAEGQRPHITLCTRTPWKPRHSNEVLEAARPFLESSIVPLGKWFNGMEVGNFAVLDLFVLPVESPVVLQSCPLRLS